MPRLAHPTHPFYPSVSHHARTLLVAFSVSCGVTPVLALDVTLDIAQPEVPLETRSSSLPSLHSDIKFSVLAPPRKADPSAEEALLKAQTLRITAALQGAARNLYADKMERLGSFDVYVAESRNAETLSSATGKIALYGGIADLKPGDDWLAFVISREMGHVLAGHHDDNSAASLLTSVILNLIIPGSGLVKSALSFAGSQAAAATGSERQIREADEIAVKLLAAAGYRPVTLALNLAQGPLDERLGTSSWADALRKSAQTLIAQQSDLPVGHARGAAPAMALAPVSAAAEVVVVAPAVVIAQPEQSAALSLPASQTFSRNMANEMPLVRTRPSGIAGPLMLGGYLVPVRRIE
jgi:Zn-dependent protease with chaperone function